MLEGSCHCGAVRLTLPRPPKDVADCNCSICRRHGGLWAYYRVAELSVTGETDTYVWGDRMLALHRCKTCGVVTHWSPLVDNIDRTGVNMRMFDPALVASLPVRKLDNA
ncbi:MAG TPA: GFA family protein [Caulobacteraceae bacterium]|jgi:hypothetical protein